MNDTDMYSLGPLEMFHANFLQFHGYASVVVSVIGILFNVLTITVLVAKDMRTPTNHLLTCLAVSDILTMLPYIPFALHLYCPPIDPINNPEKFTYNWVYFMVVLSELTATTHAISIWLAVTLAGFRYTQIRSSCPPGPLADQQRMKKVRVAGVLVYILSVLVLIPSYMAHEIQANQIHGTNITYYGLKHAQLGTSNADTSMLAKVLIIAILTKIFPCFLIILFLGSLVHNMSVRMTRRRQRLSTARQQVNTTRMLFVVLVLFLIVELPQGLLLLLTAFLAGFQTNFYYYLGELLDFLALLNNAVNFFLYCIMSQQFRDKFSSMYLQRYRRSPVIASTSELLILREQQQQRPPNATVTTNIHEDGTNANNTNNTNSDTSPLKA
ncbi:B1 bradykinin receptor [Elysia marginata]|uniref:B1 bradykinin receptor n=1 Tax=Elysia marginata TaxID=1093978 RepID=A0AAV4GDH5_9GAST|nr:B1 bradykinin receptor [Elysia marginata]